jgi:alanine transaminase
MPLTVERLNSSVVDAKYAVRGRLALKAEELREQLKSKPGSLPFIEVINANIGNPQQLDQQPITYYRQVLALLQYPALLENESALSSFKPDVIERAKLLLSEIGSLGAYSHSKGVPYVRKSVARFIEARDGFPANPENVYLTTGASAAVANLLLTIAENKSSGILIPIPQYPLYTATLTLVNATAVPYYLEETNGWATNANDIDDLVHMAKKEGLELKAVVVINPGNPTGNVLSQESIRSIIKTAARDDLVIIADEVYQTNVFIGEFHSFKKVLRTMQQESPGKYDSVQLASLHSTSKGMIGECGQRGGYMELVGFHPEVEEHIYKLASISLCSVVSGQALIELMVNPPKEGEPSYPQYMQEYTKVFETLKFRANSLYEAFNSVEGVSCQPPQGAMYLFPQITLSDKAIAAAKAAGFEDPDEFYCMKMLEETGICVIPGSGFGQVEGTWHFRTTFLAPADDYASKWKNFHLKFVETYA